MPPPIQSQSGSKAALITWTVITSILFVVATVLAIFAHVDRNKVSLELDSTKKKLDKIAREGDANLKALEDAKNADQTTYTSDMKLMDVAFLQRDNLIRKIAGSTTTNDQAALVKSDDALKAAVSTFAADPYKNEKIKINNDSLVSAVTSSTTELKNTLDKLRATEEAREALNKKVKELSDNVDSLVKGKDSDLNKARAEVKKYQSDVTTERDNKDKQIQDIQTNSETAAKSAQDDLAKLQGQLQEATTNQAKLQAQIKSLQAKLRGVRQDVNQIVRQPDAKIIRLGGNDMVYIDLGAGDQLSAGMSFEVFDRIEGIPKPGDPRTEENLPRGKASIEVVNVTPGTSQCRVIRKTPGATLVEGDLCVNLVYDKNTKYNFVAYGKFDLDRNDLATADEADVVKRLITSWGGNVSDKVNADTDFLVVGKYPVVKEFTEEELQDPKNVFLKKQQDDEAKAYDDTLARAIELNIPVLNQSRFLYFIGYYKQSGQ